LINQIQPRFFFLRDLYEIRERPSKIYHWLAFLVAAVVAEIPWNLFVGTLFYIGWYFPVGMLPNLARLTRRILERYIRSRGSRCFSMAFHDGVATVRQHFRAIHLCICMLFRFPILILDTECSHRGNDYIVDVLHDSDLCGCVSAIGIAHYILALDVSRSPISFDNRYYVSPLQWMISAMVANALHDVSVTCTTNELSIVQPPSGMSVPIHV
jgi:ABC-type multidrug transport system permease subunit